MKILILDIETSPNLAFVWGAWKQNVGHNQWVEKSHIMSFACKWLDEEDVYYRENRKKNDKAIVKDACRWLDEADVVVTHNGRRFDIPTILGKAVIHGIAPPSPFHQVDTLQIARKEFRFVSNSLAVISDLLNVAVKDTHKNFPGFELWLACLRNEDAAWEEMKKYNIQDVITLEEVYLRFRPYARNHPNVQEDNDEGACPKCASTDIQWRGNYRSAAGISYHRFVCKCCGGWGRNRTLDKDMPRANGRNAR